MTDAQASLLIDAQGEVEIATLSREHVLNALDETLIDSLLNYFRGLADRTDVRVVILRGAGRAFCAGGDMVATDDIAQQSGTVPSMYRVQDKLARLVTAMHRCPQPIIALVQGAAAGGGFALAAAANIRIGMAGTRFIPSFIRIGLSACDCGISYFLPRLVGLAKASEIMLTGREVKAEEAVTLGLLNRLVPIEELEQEGMKLAQEICALSPLGVRMTKEVLGQNADATSLEAAVALENRTQVLLGQTEDFQEGVKAFLEKRPAQYRNR
jgi:enoyl-CoA hydratase/carnithine racemase